MHGIQDVAPKRHWVTVGATLLTVGYQSQPGNKHTDLQHLVQTHSCHRNMCSKATIPTYKYTLIAQIYRWCHGVSIAMGVSSMWCTESGHTPTCLNPDFSVANCLLPDTAACCYNTGCVVVVSTRIRVSGNLCGSSTKHSSSHTFTAHTQCHFISTQQTHYKDCLQNHTNATTECCIRMQCMW